MNADDLRRRRTDRLRLDAPVEDDLADLHRLHSDPDSWTHFPSGRHLDTAATRALLAQAADDWATGGLGYWSVREIERGPVIGFAGCRAARDGLVWNLYYRFATAVQGNGYAAEAARAAISAAASVAPDRPVVAYLLAHNVGSWRTAERIGLSLVWSGPDEGNPDAAAIRVVLADRTLDRQTLEAVRH